MTERIADATLKSNVVTGYFAIDRVTAKAEITWMNEDTHVETVEITHKGNVRDAPKCSIDQMLALLRDVERWRDRVVLMKRELDGSNVVAYPEEEKDA